MTEPARPPASREQAREAKAQVAERLSRTPGVVGVGLERVPDGGWSVRVNVTSSGVAQAVGEQLRTVAPAVPVQLRVTGRIEPTSGAGEETGSPR